MLIDLYDLLQEEEGVRELSPELEMSEFKTKKDRFPIKESELHFTFSNKGKKHIDFQCAGTVTIVIPCDKCLEPVDYKINIDYFKDLDMNKSSEEKIADLDEEVYLEGTKFDTEVFVYNEILVSLPMRILCKEDCKGICNRCGANLNMGSCQCDNAEPGTGMSKILDVFNQFKEV